MQQSLIRSWMSSPVITIPPEMDLSQARVIMNAQNIRCLPVVKNGALVGIITRRGLLRVDRSNLIPDAWRQVRAVDITIGEIMTREVITTSPDTMVPKAARAMMENKITALPVVDEKKELVGIITSSDMFRVVIEEIPALKETILIQDAMTSTVITVEPETSMLESHRLMAVERIRALPVVDGGRLVGIVTRTDLMSADYPVWLDPDRNKELAMRVEVEDVVRIMSAPVITIKPEDNITTAAKLMLDHKIHSLPVVNQQGELAGIITETDLFRVITRKFF